jgi:Cu(I)/Ag(I) efflux system membrane fusion protein
MEVGITLGKRLVAPADAVIDTGMIYIAYVKNRAGHFEPEKMVPGLKGDGRVEVVKGLKAGDKTASATNFLIDSEARPKGMRETARLQETNSLPI